MSTLTREDLAKVLDEIALLLELKGENPFKTRAYRQGAEIVRVHEADILALAKAGQLTEIKGIGEALRDKLQELAQTGQLAFHQKLRAEFPDGIFELFEIQGLGPKKVKQLYDELGVDSIEKLQKLAEAGQLADLKGFGAKTEAKLLEAIAQRASFASQFRFGSVAPLVESLLERLKNVESVNQAQIAGSYRRGKELVSDVDFLVACSNAEAVGAAFVAFKEVIQVLAHGPTKCSVVLENGLQADLRMVTTQEYPFALQYFTGSKEHNVAIRSRALKRGWSLNEYGLKAVDAQTENMDIDIQDERGIYQALGLEWIAPELRENRGEIEAAEKGELPDLLRIEQLKGCFHNHTHASDGRHSLREMADAALELGLDYLGIADHSKSSFQANGLDETRLLAQILEIEELNRQLAEEGKSFHVFAGSEVDLLKDGSLDFSDEILSRLDYCVASVHQSFQLPEEEMTARIVAAMEHPQVTMIGHLTGRLLLKREAYAVNIPQLIEVAARTGTVIELNASPMRLDMDWRWWKRAKELGVMTSINPDAHHVNHFQYLHFGVMQARKGWLTAADVLNTKNLEDVKAWLKLPKSKRFKNLTKA